MLETLIKRLELLLVPSTKLKVLDDLNVPGRIDESINDLAEDLYRNGPKVPLSGYKEGDFYIVTVGHRRKAAADIVKLKYKKTIIFKFIPLPKGTSKSDILFDHFFTNDGNPLTPLQKAFGVAKLLAEDVKVKEIATKLGYSDVYINNLKILAEAPTKTHDLVNNGMVSSTMLITQLKKKGDIDAWITAVASTASKKEGASQHADALADRVERNIKKAATGKKVKATGSKAPAKKTAKVTAKDMKINSIKLLKKFIKQGGGANVTKEKAAIYAFVDDLLQNKYDAQDLITFFTE